MDYDVGPPETYRDWNDPRYPNFSPWKFVGYIAALQLGGSAALLGSQKYMNTLSETKVLRNSGSKRKPDDVVGDIEKPPVISDSKPTGLKKQRVGKPRPYNPRKHLWNRPRTFYRSRRNYIRIRSYRRRRLFRRRRRYRRRWH